MDIRTIVIVLFCQIIFAEKDFSWRSRYYNDAQNYISKIKKSPEVAKVLKNQISLYDEFKVHSLEGLSEFLQPVQHCLIHMTNFGGVDLPDLTVASIQRKTKPAVCYHAIFAISSSLEIRPNTTNGRIHRLSCHETIPRCPLSPLFGNSLFVCVGLNFRRFVTKIRPWTCEVIVSIYPQQIPESPESIQLPYIELIDNILPLFEEDPLQRSINRFVRRSIPSYSPINILITEMNDALVNPQTLESPNLVGAWLKHSLNDKYDLDYEEKRIFRDAFFVMFTKPSAFTSKHYELHNISCKFAVQLKLSFGNYEVHLVSGELFLNHLRSVRTTQEKETEVKIFDLTPIADVIFAMVFFKHGSVLTKEKFLYECFCNSKYLKMASNHPQKRGELYILNWIGEWLQVLRRHNFTVLMNMQYIICNTRDVERQELEFVAQFIGESSIVQLEEKVYPTAVPHPLAIEDPSRKMGFISCGSTAVQGLPFRELFRVFDIYVWACLIIFNSIIMPVVLCTIEWLSDKNQTTSDHPDAVRKVAFTSRIFFQPVIILLEQGSAFTNKNLNAAALRWVAAALILVGIVLSNSYKYDNVYNMMLPRRTAPLWFFEQLLTEKFSIYTRTNFYNPHRTSQSLIYSQFNYSVLPPYLSGHVKFVANNNSKPHMLLSELISIYHFEAVDLDFLNTELLLPWQAEHGPNNGSNQVALDIYGRVFRKLLTNTKLLPFENTLPHESVLNTFPSDHQFLAYMKEFNSKQAKHFMQILNEYQNTAFVLPFDNMVNLFGRLRNQGNSKLTIGKEVLVERNIGMALHGWISNNLINTLVWIQDFGFLKHVRNIYWENVTSISHATFDYSHQSSQISGNILVIFATLLCGHLLAIISYIFEIRKQIYMRIVTNAKAIYLYLGKIWSRSPFLNNYLSSRCRRTMRNG
ncbi:unnamed protein product [Orchesella dallaii]|uniref:Uncharacterized protein n=1 Tax=Orchesella dallaii TaxID=48710 RepID=A0ABP1RXZ9_9HEXA